MTEEELLKRFALVEKELNVIMTKAFLSKKSNAEIRRIVYEDVEKLISSLEVSTNTYVDSAVLDEYKLGLKNTTDQLLAAKFIEKSAIQIEYATNFGVAPQTMKDRVENLVEGYKASWDDSFKAARGTAKNNLSRVLRQKDVIKDAQNLLDPAIRQKAIDSTKLKVAREAFSEKSIDQVTREVTKEFEKLTKGNAGVMFRDRGGNRWSYSRYSEFMTREITTTSYREGQRDNFLDVGLDVVKTNDTGTTDSCLVWQGKLLSLTGKTAGLPTYSQVSTDSTHFFKFGCRHELIYVSAEEFTKASKKN